MSFDASYIYRIKDLYSAALNRISRATEKFDKKVKKVKKSLQHMNKQTKENRNRMDDMRASMGALAGTYGMVSAIKGMVDTASEFEAAMNKVEAVSGAGARSMKLMREQARMLGEKTQFSATQAAQGMTFLAMAGMKTNQIMEAMPGVLNLAAAGGLDLASAADIATNVVAQFGLQIKDLGRVNDVLATAAASANTNVFEMAEALKNAGSLANLAGMDIEQVSSALMIMANAGIKGGEAGTQLMNVFRELSTGGPKVRKLFKSLGLNIKNYIDPATGVVKDFSGIIKALGKTTDKSELGLKRFTKAFDVRAAKGMAVLAKAGGDAFDEMGEKLKKATGASRKMADIMMKGLPGAEKRLKSATESLSLSFTATFLPVLADVMGMLSDLFANLARNHPVILKITAAFAALAITLGAVATAYLVLKPVVAAISLPMIGITAAIGAAAAGLYFLIKWLKKSGVWEKFAKWVGSAWESVKEFTTGLNIFQFLSSVLKVVWSIIGDIAGVVWKLAKVVGGVLWQVFKGTFKFIGSIVKFVIKIVDNLFGLIEAFVLLLTGDFSGAWQKVKDIAMSFVNGILDILKSVWDTITGIVGEIRSAWNEFFNDDDENVIYLKKYEEIMGKEPSKKLGEQYTVGKTEGKDLATIKAERELTVKGGIRVSAEKGTKVREAKIYTQNNGRNLAGVGATGSW